MLHRTPATFLRAALIATAALLGNAVWAGAGFSFAKEAAIAQDQQNQEDAQRRARVSALLQTPCRNQIKNQKIMVLIGESRNGQMITSQSSFGPHFDAINVRLRALGLKTYTQAQIRAQIAQAEIDAHFRNDPDAALGAARKLAAQYVLRGVINTSAQRNLAVQVNQVNIGMDFTLTGANGKLISQVSAKDASYAGADVSGMALTLINEKAAELVATLYSDYCQQAGLR